MNKRVYEPEVRWLREMAKGRLGYEDFKKRRNRALNNADVVKSWTFAVEFCKEYNKAYLELVDSQRYLLCYV